MLIEKYYAAIILFLLMFAIMFALIIISNEYNDRKMKEKTTLNRQRTNTNKQ